jgi:hypothetical protein
MCRDSSAIRRISDEPVWAGTAQLTFDIFCCPWNALPMPSHQTRNVSLPAELNRFIYGQAAHGQHRNTNEVAHVGLRLPIQTRRDLKANRSPEKRERNGR